VRLDDVALGVPFYRELDRDALAHDETMLRELFGLLVAAHYRTSPRDLSTLLDAPDVEVHALFSGSHPIAAAMIAREGGLDAERIDSMRRGLLRPAGHAMPETFVAHCRLPSAGALTGMRIVRIAVHPALQRRGLGTQLLSKLEEI